MFTVIPDMPVGTFGSRATRTISTEDYRDTLMPVLEKALAPGDARALWI